MEYSGSKADIGPILFFYLWQPYKNRSHSTKPNIFTPCNLFSPFTGANTPLFQCSMAFIYGKANLLGPGPEDQVFSVRIKGYIQRIVHLKKTEHCFEIARAKCVNWLHFSGGPLFQEHFISIIFLNSAFGCSSSCISSSIFSEVQRSQTLDRSQLKQVRGNC